MSKFRTGVKNDKEQTCYFNYSKKDGAFNRILAIRKETPANKIFFSIVNLIDKSNNFEDICYKISDELRKLSEHNKSNKIKKFFIKYFLRGHHQRTFLQ